VPSNLGVAGSWNLGIKSSPFAPYWLIVNDDVTFASGSLARFAWEGSNVGTISLCADVSPWCAFTLGDSVVDCVGLFDEVYYPAYFEDTDYAHRVLELMGQDAIYHTDIAVNHVNSATINSGFNEANHRTYLANHDLWGKQLAASTFDPIGWQLGIRRTNDWGI
jgi:GT2 family glycosyltransferase